MGYRIFRAFFGTSPQVCEIVWDMLTTRRPPNSVPEHLLWALMLLKQYNIESVNATLVGVTEKTFRKWSLIYIRLIAHLPVVNKIYKKIPLYIRTKPFLIYSFISLTGKGVSKTHLKAPLRSFHLTEPTFVSWNQQSSIVSDILTNFMDLDYGMRSVCASAPETLYGPTEGFLVVNGLI